MADPSQFSTHICYKLQLRASFAPILSSFLCSCSAAKNAAAIYGMEVFVLIKINKLLSKRLKNNGYSVGIKELRQSTPFSIYTLSSFRDLPKLK